MILSDGSSVHVRPVREDDRAAMAEFFGGLTPDSLGFRFFTAAANVEQEAARAVHVDHADRYALIATRGEDGHPVGHSAYYRTSRAEPRSRSRWRTSSGPRPGHDPARPPGRDGGRARDRDLRGRGPAQNHRMIEVFRESGFPVKVRSVPGSIHIELPTSFGSGAVERFEDRDRSAAAAAVGRFIAPRSVAVIGASRERDTSAARSSTTSSMPVSKGPPTPSTGKPMSCSRSGPTAASARSRDRSTSRWSPFPRRR